MTDDEAVRWVKRQADHGCLQAMQLVQMLARPVMPEKADQEALSAMARKHHGVLYRYQWEEAYADLRAHLTKPATKTVWRVCGVWSNGDKAGPADFPTLKMAADAAESWRREGCHSMTISDVKVSA